MISQIARKRTSFENQDWEQVRELMPRRQGTRGIQYEALEYLYEHLYEKISEEQLREHFIRVKGRLQQKGDPVKSAINLAIKELQRLHRPTFDLIKIQEASLVGKTRRYVKLNFTGFDAVIDFTQFRSYLEDMLSDDESPYIRSVFTIPPHANLTVFPGIDEKWLTKIHSCSLISSAERFNIQSPRARYYNIPESQGNVNFIMLYENEESILPFLAFMSNAAAVSTLENSRYFIYRGEEKLEQLKYLHKLWTTQKEVALDMEEVDALWNKTDDIYEKCKDHAPDLDQKSIFRGLLATQVRTNWKNRIEHRQQSNPSS